ncbi:hypothetical protein WG904_12460 [Pedobacter sp. Du54]|uniref:hypothetical protein n=1 Tax=Pedobacter anseongensis TaxID=3133439 RepID=UPI0030996491
MSLLKGSNSTFTLEQIRREEIWKNSCDDYFVYENNINRLLGDGMVKQIEGGYISLSNKGFAVMAEIETYGYTRIQKNANRENIIKYVIYCVTISTFLILLFRTFILKK